MLGEPSRDRLAERRQAVREEILGAAWDVAHTEGLGGLTLRAVAEQVGMRAPSLYTHFASKNAIYDAMFAQAWHEYEQDALAAHAQLPVGDSRAVLHAVAHQFFDFAVADPVRYQLMNQRTLPDFEPSLQAYAPAVRVLELARDVLHSAGVDRPEDVDIWVALMTGMVDQQLANDPGGSRWADLLDRAVDTWARGLDVPEGAATTGTRSPRSRRTTLER